MINIKKRLATIKKTGCKWDEVCNNCNGEGRVDTNRDWGREPKIETCGDCKGRGVIKTE